LAKTNVSVGRDPLFVQDNFEPSHLLIAKNVVIGIVKQQHTQSMGLEVILFVQPEIGSAD
jgi:hypothetical protein